MAATYQQFSEALAKSGLMKNLSPELMQVLQDQYTNATPESLEQAVVSLNKGEADFLQRQKTLDEQKMLLAKEIHELAGKEQQAAKTGKMEELKKLETQSRLEEAKALEDVLKNI